ncbi:recombining binding protein suppressor of hairless-like [Oscarella lobularis]|uniref:recombining binding protein suppressor of hairless-like n=1 Tax=Oscarella lobularis TaxID=121494 RepID=UPI0033131726
MSYRSGGDIGVFLLRLNKVMSSASRRTKHLENTDRDVCIPFNSQVGIFDHLPSKTVSTRYLHVDKTSLHASSDQWEAFKIHLVDENEGEKSFVHGVVHYGQTVKLVCTKTGWNLPPLVIRKVENQTAILDANGPVTQLQKVAFYIKDSKMYFSAIKDEVFQCSAATPLSETREKIGNYATWTIISTDQVEYTFSEGMGPVPTPVTPFPCATATSMNGVGLGMEIMMEISGENFTPDLKVWIGEAEAKTTFR